MLIREDFSSGLFSIGEMGGRKPWFYHQHGTFVGRDPRAVVSVTLKGLAIHIPHYTLTGKGMEDHVKFVFWKNDLDPETREVGTMAPVTGALIYEMKGRAEGLNTSSNPFNAALDDYRLSCGAALTTDLATHTGCHFLFNATRAFAVYERYLFVGWDRDPAGSFCYVVPVAEFPAGSEHSYRISYVRETNAAAWFLDGKQVFGVGKLGSRLGPEQEQYLVYPDLPGTPAPYSPPERRLLGAGLLTLLDAGKRRGEALVDLDLSDVPKAQKLFGQGGKLVVSEIRIWTE